MISILVSLWPLFALIVAGQAMRRWDFPGHGFWPGAERINYFLLFPALLFTSLASAPLHDPALPRLLGGVVLVLSICVAGLLAARRLRRWPAARFGVLAQGMLRFNTYLGIAAVSGLYGREGMAIATVVIALLVPMVNVLSVLAFAADHGPRRLDALLLPIATNPLILACVAGVASNLSGIVPGGGVDRLLAFLANTSLPLGLLCVGAALQRNELRGQGTTLFVNSLARLLLVPGVALLAARWLVLPPLETATLVLFFALPTAPTSYILARQLGGDSHLMAGIITLQTLLSALTLPLVVAAAAP